MFCYVWPKASKVSRDTDKQIYKCISIVSYDEGNQMVERRSSRRDTYSETLFSKNAAIKLDLKDEEEPAT